MKKDISVSIIIPNWNGVELLEKHIPVVIKNSKGAKIIVVDDCSGDDSVSYLEKNFPEISIVSKKKHEGFASTVNAGVEASKTDIVVLLNTDIEPQENFLIPLLPHFSDSNVFAVGCMDKSMENGKTILRGRGIGWWEKGFYIHKRGEIDRTDTSWVSGGSSAFRRSMWNMLGGMDVIFSPFYWEDIDLSYRARKTGWKVLFEPKSIVYHFHEKGTIKNEYSEKTIAWISYRNQFLFIWKNCTDPQIMLSHIWFTPIRLLQTIFSGDFMMLKGFVNALGRILFVSARRGKQQCRYTRKDRELSM